MSCPGAGRPGPTDPGPASFRPYHRNRCWQPPAVAAGICAAALALLLFLQAPGARVFRLGHGLLGLGLELRRLNGSIIGVRAGSADEAGQRICGADSGVLGGVRTRFVATLGPSLGFCNRSVIRAMSI